MSIIFITFKAAIHTCFLYLKSKNVNFTEVLKIFVVRFFFVFTFIRLIQKEKKILKNITYEKSILFSENEVNNVLLLNNIKQNGYYFGFKLNDNYNNSLTKNLLKYKKFFTYKQKQFDLEQNYFQTISDLDKLIYITLKKNIAHLTVKFDPFQNNLVNELGQSPFFIDLAFNYLNSDKISYSSLLYISNPGQKIEDEKSLYAQKFHFDCEYSKLLKIFVYLTDVDKSSGPHIYVPKTHKKRLFKHTPPQRIQDDEILENYENPKEFTGKKGTVIIEDTFGFHKGEEPLGNSRAMLVYVYGKNIINYDKSYRTISRSD